MVSSAATTSRLNEMSKATLHLPSRYKARELAKTACVAEPSPESLRARDDFGFFCEWVTRNSPESLKPAEHHKEWHHHLVTEQDSKCLLRIAGKNVDLLAPRGSAKSTVLTLYVAWVIGIHTQAARPLQILYISYALSAARAKSAAIKQVLTSPEYQEIFPSVKKGRKWSDDYWTIDRTFAGIKSTGNEEFTMICAGASGTITSKRSHLVILDDIIKSPEQIESIEVREKISRNWGSVIRPTMLEGGRAICLGTRFRADDIHETTFIPAKGWIQIEQQAILVDEESGEERSYWGDMWSLEYLRQLRLEDAVSFAFQYMNKVMRVGDISLDPAWIHYSDIPESFDSLAVGIDLAASLKEKADFTVLTLVGKKDDRFYMLDYRRGKWVSNLEKLMQLVELYEEWAEPGTPFTVFPESVAYQASLAGDFVQYVHNQLHLYEMRCTPFTIKGDKLEKLRSVTGLYANGMVYYNQYKDWGYPIREMTDFGSMQHDDCMDSKVLVLRGLASRRRLEAA